MIDPRSAAILSNTGGGGIRPSAGGGFNPTQKILEQMGNIGKPLVTTQKTKGSVTQPDEPLDIGSILMMLMMSGLFGGGAPGEVFGATPTSPVGGFNPGPMGSPFNSGGISMLLQSLL